MTKIPQNETKSILDGLIDLFSPSRQWLLFFGTGTSCELDKGLGMSALAEHLCDVMGDDAGGWPDVRSRLASEESLERALTDVALHPETKLRIQELTGDYVADRDLRLRDNVLLGKRKWVGETLLSRLVQRLPRSNPRLPVVTANYDMLIEYSCAKNCIRYTTGYAGELLRTWDWKQAQDSLNRRQTVHQRGKNVVYGDPLPRVELHKVHGSINLFRQPDGNGLFECDAWTKNPPTGCSREVAAPGDQKFKSFAKNPDSGYGAREAEDKAMAFLMIGYGFNDVHLHDRILERVRRSDCPLLVLSLEIPDVTIAMLRKCGTHVWILTAGKNAEGNPLEDQTRVNCPLADDTLLMEHERLWSCDSFAEKILGG